MLKYDYISDEYISNIHNVICGICAEKDLHDTTENVLSSLDSFLTEVSYHSIWRVVVTR